jgi:hypothetical protein
MIVPWVGARCSFPEKKRSSSSRSPDEGFIAMTTLRVPQIVFWLAGACAASSPQVAGAASAVVLVPRATVHTQPNDDAGVFYTLISGYPICLVDGIDDDGVTRGLAEPHPGWRGVRLPRGAMGYVRSESVELANTSNTAVSPCNFTEAPPSRGDGAGPVATKGKSIRAESTSPVEGLWWRRTRPDNATAFSLLALDPLRFTIAVMTGAGWLDPATATQYQIGSSGPVLYFAAGFVIWDLFSVTAAGGGMFPSDDAPFTQRVVSTNYNFPPTNATSKVGIDNLSVALGPRTPWLVLKMMDRGAVAAAVFAEYGWASISGDRSIADCTNCRKDTFNMADGSFWRLGAEVGAISWDGMEMSYTLMTYFDRYRAGASLRSELRIGLSISFG